MGQRAVVVKQSVAKSIAEIALFIESKGMVQTAEKFSDAVYDFFETLADSRKSFRPCKEPSRSSMGYKCISFRKNIQSSL